MDETKMTAVEWGELRFMLAELILARLPWMEASTSARIAEELVVLGVLDIDAVKPMFEQWVRDLEPVEVDE